MATTTNFGWETPDDTDLVKDGALAIRTLGSAIDTSLVDLKGGTTGQVLSKNSNTDMDFTWVTSDDANAIQNAIVDAKGDLISATAADTPARLAVGTDGQVLTADSTTATGLKWNTATSGGWTQLATASLPTNATTVTISNLSTDYRMLVIMVRDFYSASDDYMKIRFNQNTGIVYGEIMLNHSAENTVAPTADGSADAIWLNDTAFDSTSKENFVYIQVPDYANTVTHKSGSWNGKARNGSNTYEVNWSGTFNFQSTSAITEVTIFTNGSNWSGGDYIIYGVK